MDTGFLRPENARGLCGLSCSEGFRESTDLQTLYVKPCGYRHYCRENLYGLNHVLNKILHPKRLKTTGLEINRKVTLEAIPSDSKDQARVEPDDL